MYNELQSKRRYRGGIAFSMVGDHEDRPTDMTNLVVLESNQNHATITKDVCPTLPASMGMGGGYVPMIAFSKRRRASSKDDYETWEESNTTNTLNQFDGGGTQGQLM